MIITLSIWTLIFSFIGITLIFAPIILWWGFPFYASVKKAWDEDKLSKGDLVSFGLPLLYFYLVDIWVECTWGCALFRERPFKYGITLSDHCCYWIDYPDSGLRYGSAHAVKVQTDKFEPGYITGKKK